MAPRNITWKYAFFGLVFFMVGGGGIGALAWWTSSTLKYWTVYVASAIVGLVGFGFSMSLMLRRKETEEETVDLPPPE